MTAAWLVLALLQGGDEGETKRELAILYEDRECLAVDKPAHIAVHPSGRHMTDTLIQRVHLHFKEEVEAGRMVPRLCHRVDRETSGIVLVAYAFTGGPVPREPARRHLSAHQGVTDLCGRRAGTAPPPSTA